MKKTQPLYIHTPCWIQSQNEAISQREEAEERFQRRLFPMLCLILGIVIYAGLRFIVA